MKLIRAYLACKGGVLPCSQKYTPHRVHFCLHTTNPQPKPFQPTSSPPMQRNTPQCGVTKQCVAKECGAKMWRHRKMWRHQTMCRQRMWRQNVASQENVASPNNVAPNNVAPKCGVTGKIRRHQTMWRQTMQRQNVASQENAASPNNVAPKKVAPHVFEMCLHNVSSASGGKVRALLPTPCIFLQTEVQYVQWILEFWILVCNASSTTDGACRPDIWFRSTLLFDFEDYLFVATKFHVRNLLRFLTWMIWWYP